MAVKGDTLYVVIWDNGEPYEDRWWHVDAIFETRVEALKYIRSNGYRKVEGGVYELSEPEEQQWYVPCMYIQRHTLQ